MDRFLSIKYELTPRQGLHGILAELSDWAFIKGWRGLAEVLADVAYSRALLSPPDQYFSDRANRKARIYF